MVIVVGLPGDLESEKTYTDETVKLLGLMDNPDMAPKNVLLLSNLSALPELKPNYPLEKLSNERTTFLGLTEKIKASSPATPVFIFFGHGGTQGTTPVFHVPGPRLIPSDLSAVAGTAAASTWLFFFPGSSAFAAQVQALQRTVLATESGQVFSQDPISFALFLDLLASEHNLDSLAPKLGAATDHWYESRSLARTEEPALWIAGQPPRKLDALNATANPAPTVAIAAQSPPSDGTAPPDDAWKNIQPVDPRDYPQSDAVMLSRHESFLIDDTSEISEDEETFVQILKPGGKRFGDFEFTFTPPNEDMTFSACEVRRADGQIETLDPDDIHESTGNAPEGYNAPNQKMFSLPHAEPGSILHVHWQRVSKRFQVPHAFEEVALNAEIPVLALKIEMSVPEKSAFHFKFCHQAATDPVIAKTTYGLTYTWQYQNIPASPQEPLGPSGESPVLVASTFPDWAAFADWYRRLIRESDTVTPEIAAQARALTKDAGTDEEKIAVVTQFVTNFRYVAIPLGVNSFRPHSAANILKSRYGDCKDKANLLNALLTSLGYKTSLVLVPRFAQAYADLPGFAFNHAISQVQLNGQVLWIDSTDDVCRIGLLPPGDPGRKVLVVNDPTNTLAELPKAIARDHRLALQMAVNFPEATDRVAQVQVAAQTAGYPDYMLRASAKSWDAQAKIAPLLSGMFYPTSGQFQARAQSGTDVSDLSQDFSWKADGPWSGLISQLPQSPIRLLRLPCWLPKEWPTALLPRTTPLHLNEGYPMEISQACVIHLPVGAHDLKLPEPQHEDNPVLSWKLSWSQPSPSEVDVRLDLSLLEADLNTAATQSFQASCRHLQDTLQDGLSFQVQ